MTAKSIHYALLLLVAISGCAFDYDPPPEYRRVLRMGVDEILHYAETATNLRQYQHASSALMYKLARSKDNKDRLKYRNAYAEMLRKICSHAPDAKIDDGFTYLWVFSAVLDNPSSILSSGVPERRRDQMAVLSALYESRPSEKSPYFVVWNEAWTHAKEFLAQIEGVTEIGPETMEEFDRWLKGTDAGTHLESELAKAVRQGRR